MKSMTKRFVLVVAVLGFAAGQARAGIVTYSSRSAFESAVSGEQTITFEGLAPTGSFAYVGPSLTTGGVTFASDVGFLYVYDPGYDARYTLGSGQALVDHMGSTTIHLQAGTTAVGFDLDSIDNGYHLAATIYVGNAGGDSYTVDAPAPKPISEPRSPVFIGFTSDTPITSLWYAKWWYLDVIIDNFSTGTTNVSAVPEPSTLAGAGIAVFLGLACAWRRRKAKHAA
jgi:PEP-CTERM motif